MKKNLTTLFHNWGRAKTRQWLMRLTVLKMILLMSLLTSYGRVNSQMIISSLKLQEVDLSEALVKIEEQTDYDFVFSYDDVQGYKVTVDLQSASLEECLNAVLYELPFEYTTEDDVVIVSYKKPEPVIEVEQEKKEIKGKVTDDQGIPLPGVSVVIKGINVGVATDIDGNYEISFENENVVLVFSFVGMTSQEFVYSGQEVINVELQADSKQIGEVIVTGFQTIEKERSTGSFSIVNSKELDQKLVTSLSSGMEGLSAGVSIYNDKITIRGVSTFSENTQPLIVLDGLPYEGELDDINTKVVESITVLKDAAAASIYGARATNGVIVIKTTSAEIGTHFSASVDYTFTQTPDLGKLDYASSSDVIDYEVDFLTNHTSYIADPLAYLENNFVSQGSYMSPVYDLYYQYHKGDITESELSSHLNEYKKNDYVKEYQNNILRKSVESQYNFTMQTGNQKNKFSIFANLLDNKMNTINNNRTKVTVNLKNDLKVNDWFDISFGIQSVFSKSKNTTDTGQEGRLLPYQQMFDKNGDMVHNYITSNRTYIKDNVESDTELFSMGYNAYEEHQRNFRKSNLFRNRFNVDAKAMLFKDLRYNLKFSYEQHNIENRILYEKDSYKMRELINRFADPDIQGNSRFNIPIGGELDTQNGSFKTYTLRNQIDYNRETANGSLFSALVGTEVRETWGRNESTHYLGYDDQVLNDQPINWRELRYGVKGSLSPYYEYYWGRDNQFREDKHRFFSVFGNFSYSLKNRFNFTGSIRMDQADLFGSDPKYRYRPLWSLGSSWNMTNEKFIENLDVINFLQLRTSYGLSGNVDQTSSPYLVAGYWTSPFTGNPYGEVVTPPNPLLRWEKTTSYNVGLDLQALNRRLSFTLDWYYRKSSDLLTNKSLDASTGFSTLKVNNGALSNKGVEFSLSYEWLKTKDFSVQSALVASYNQNEITKMNFKVAAARSFLYSPQFSFKEGDPLHSLYAFKYAGLSEEGAPSIYNAEGEITTDYANDPEMLVNTGTVDPKWSGNFSNSVRYKGLELSMQFVFYAGHKMRKNSTKLYYEIRNGSPIHEDIANRWTPDNTTTDVPIMGAGNYGEVATIEDYWKYSDVNVADASFVKLRSLALSYTIPQNWLAKTGFKEVKLRGQANNLWYWAANKEGVDPETINAYTGKRSWPQMPSYVFGLNVKF